MLAPYFACQTPLVMFLKEQVYRDNDKNWKLWVTSVIMVSPCMLVYIFVLDIIFIVNQALLFPIISMIKAITCEKLDLTCLNSLLDKSYEILFNM